MYRPPSDPHDPRDRFAPTRPTWRSVLASYALVAAVPLLLWAAVHPLAGGVILAGAVGLAVAARRALGLLRCFRDCPGFAVVAGPVRIAVTPARADEPS